MSKLPPEPKINNAQMVADYRKQLDTATPFQRRRIEKRIADLEGES